MTPDQFAALIEALLVEADKGGMSTEDQIAVLERIVEALKDFSCRISASHVQYRTAFTNRRRRLMDAPEIAERVLKIIAQTLGDVPEHDIAMSKSLVDDLGMDSLDVADLVVQLETEFEIEISYSEADGVRTVQDVIDSVQRNIGAKANQ